MSQGCPGERKIPKLGSRPSSPLQRGRVMTGLLSPVELSGVSKILSQVSTWLNTTECCLTCAAYLNAFGTKAVNAIVTN